MRDRLIVEDLTQFRVLSRDQLIKLHFESCKDAVSQCNRTMRRLTLKGEVSVDKTRRMYLYKPKGGIKTNSSKTDHYLDICNFYLELKRFEKPRYTIIEPKFAKGGPEPDLFCIWRGAPFWVEIQRTKMDAKQWKEKLMRYVEFYHSGVWKQFEWQTPGKEPVFPRLWIYGESAPNVIVPFKIVQTRTVEELIKK